MRIKWFLLALFLCGSGLNVYSATPARVANGTLKLKAGYIVRSGEIRFLADKNFFVTKKSFLEQKTPFEKADFLKIANDNEFDPTGYVSFTDNCSETVSYSDIFRIQLERAVLYERMLNNRSWQSFIVANPTKDSMVCSTDFNGVCTVSNIPAGSYYIVSGPIERGPNSFGWDLPVKIEPSKTTYIELKNSNMADLTPIADNIRRKCRI